MVFFVSLISVNCGVLYYLVAIIFSTIKVSFRVAFKEIKNTIIYTALLVWTERALKSLKFLRTWKLFTVIQSCFSLPIWSPLRFNLFFRASFCSSLWFSTCTNPIIHLFYPPKICIGIVLDYSWDMFMSQEKLQTMRMQNFGGVKEVHYGIVQVVNTVFNQMIETSGWFVCSLISSILMGFFFTGDHRVFYNSCKIGQTVTSTKLYV